tara:strand:- start:2362 stop:3315 length:954 start_codon:yes stop_codon:yes gene_type:complete
MNKNFALIGASGYIAPRHMNAIKETGNNLIAAYDPYDGIGIMDSYFPNSSFFTEFERFDRFVDKWHRKTGKRIDYVSICSPNYLHDSHIRFALKYNSHAICEKPLVLNPWNIDQLKELENESDKKINCILQLRYHPSIIKLKKEIDKIILKNKNKIFDIDLTYITSRGKWYYHSWKGNEDKSGGISTNIGIHFFDMLIWIFGDVLENKIFFKDKSTNSGYLKLKNANVKWFLTIDGNHLPNDIKKKKQTTYRSIKINDKELEFSSGFKDLHTVSYQNILNGKGFDIVDSKKSINVVSEIRNKEIEKINKKECHRLIK